MANTKVTTGVIKDDAVGADQLASNSVVTASIVDNAITTAKINNDAILTAKISNSAITNAKMSANSVDSDQYVDGSIDTAHIGDGQITSAKLDTNIAVSGELTVGSHLNMGDGDILKMGASADLQIYHDGSYSYMREVGTGDLRIGGASNVQIWNSDIDSQMANFANGGAVTLYYAGATKLATTSSGIDVTGTIISDSLTVDTSTLVVDATNNRVGIGTSSPDTQLHLNATTGSVVRLARQDGSVVANDSLGKIEFYTNDATNTGVAGYIDVQAESGAAGGAMIFGTGTAGSASEQVRISSNGNVGIGTDNPSQPLTVSKAGDLYIQVNNSSAGFNTYLGTYTNESRIVCDGAKPIAFFVNGSRVVDFANGGNVGIGTDSPAEKLHIRDSSTNADVYIKIANDSRDWFMGVEGSNSDILSFKTHDASNLLNITSSGKVGIGESAPSNAKLEILQAGDHDAHSTHGIAIHSTGNTNFTSMYIGCEDAIDAAYIQSVALDGSFTSKSLLLNANGGNVGIGTIPATELHVKASSGDCELRLEAVSGSIARLRFGDATDNDAGYISYSRSLGFINFSALNTAGEHMRINSSGTLLVSTTSTSGLSNGTSNYGHSFGGGQQVNATNNDTNLILNMSNGSSNPHIQFRSDGGNTGSISTNGSAVAYNTGSDYRLKENVIPLKDGLDRLNKLNPVQFDWKESQETDEGFIAHEVQEIVPYVVKGEKDGKEIQTMDYGKLTPLLVKAIQEQQEQIETLKAEIQELKG